ncbi:MAG: hypothetical protein KAG66_10325 [Methylococcales bacterium]|nr:hypothetical protein [Methylococcales bacterium]
MPTNYFEQGMALGSAFSNIKKKKEKNDQDAQELAMKEQALQMQQNEVDLAADLKAQEDMVSTKARLGYSLLNTDDPDGAWQAAKKTHPGLVNEGTDRREIQGWILGGVDSGVLGKDFVMKQTKEIQHRYKLDEMGQAQENDQTNAFRDNKLQRGMVDYKLDASNQRATHATDQRMRTQNLGMQHDRERGGITMGQIQARNPAKPAAPNPGGMQPQVQGFQQGQAPQGFQGQAPQGQDLAGGDGFGAGGRNDKGMAMVARMMDKGGAMNIQEVASVWKDTAAIMGKKGLNPETDGPRIAESVAKAKATEGKAIKVLSSQGVSPEDAVVALRMVAKENPQDDDTALIRKTLKYFQGMQ